MSDSTLAFNTGLKPRLITNNPKKSKVYFVNIPKFGRIAFTRDGGEASPFETDIYRTNLSLVHRSPEGDLLGQQDCGSGKVTNVGALALAYDGVATLPGVKSAPANLFANLKFHAWGKSATAAANTDIKLTSAEKPTGQTEEAIEGVNTVTTSGTGSPKLVSKATITAESTFKVEEWAIFTQKKLEATTGTPLTAQTATSATVTGTPLVASSGEAKGETLKIMVPTENSAAEAKSGWGLIFENSTSVVKVPAWYTAEAGGAYTPKATSAYKLYPVMFDHRVIEVISVETGNKIEFIWELEIKSGG